MEAKINILLTIIYEDIYDNKLSNILISLWYHCGEVPRGQVSDMGTKS